MKRVAPWFVPRASRASTLAFEIANGHRAPRWRRTAGRGRSVGNWSTAGRSAKCSRHSASCCSRRSPVNQRRCQRAKSATWSGKGSSWEPSSPAVKAVYRTSNSRTSTPIDHPSETMWCKVRSTMCSSVPRRTNKARSSGPRVRSNGRRDSASNSSWATTVPSATADKST